jgi:hypothetical protein
VRCCSSCACCARITTRKLQLKTIPRILLLSPEQREFSRAALLLNISF